MSDKIAAGWNSSPKGRIIISTPKNPNRIAKERKGPTLSPRMGQERRQMMIGAVNSMVAVTASGKN